MIRLCDSVGESLMDVVYIVVPCGSMMFDIFELGDSSKSPLWYCCILP